MPTDRLTAYAAEAALDRGEDRQTQAARPWEPSPDVTPGGPPYRLLWCRIAAGAPADSPDERYTADEVRPAGADGDGRLTWENASEGQASLTIHNVAEAATHTHLLAEGMIVRVEERLDRSSPPEFVYATHVPVVTTGDLLARIVSYDDGTYTVQPVRRDGGGYADDGPAIDGVPNPGELWDEEAGYLAGPEGFERYVRLFWTAAGWTMLLHPPRLV